MSLRHMLMAMLSKEPNSGYGIGRLLRQNLGHIWYAKLQQIYGELAKLQADGLVNVERIDIPVRRPKKVYSLTDAGQVELDHWLTVEVVSRSTKDDLLVRLYAMERIPRDSLIRLLEGQRDTYKLEARDLRSRLANTPRTDPESVGVLVTLQAACFRTEGRVAWLERTLEWLHSVGAAADLPAFNGG